MDIDIAKITNNFDKFIVRPLNAFGLGGFIFDIEGDATVNLNTEITDHFTEDEEMVFYTHGDLDELKRKIDHYLADDEARETIRRAGHERTKKDHTYTERWRHILDTLGLS